MKSTSTVRVLLVDDDAMFGAAMGKALGRRGFAVTVLGSGEAAVAALGVSASGEVDVVVLDLRMPGIDGLEVLRRTPGRTPPVVVLTGHGSVPDAVEAMRLGAYTFMTKPVDAATLAPVLRQAVLPRVVGVVFAGDSPSTAQLRRLLDRLSDSEEPVLLMGETGTGKEVAARYLHERARRHEAPFVAVNMACLPPHLIESELFGHARGAFTGADRRKAGLFTEVGEGTLFLDEIAELPLAHQAKLLRVIETRTFRAVGETQERPFQGRLVTATHRRLEVEVAAGRFRQDLFYRLQVLPLLLPPLRDRTGDILPIAQHWLSTVVGSRLRFSVGAAAALQAHRWPGNAREVVNLVRRVALFAEGPEVSAALVRQMLDANPFAPASVIDQGVDRPAVTEISPGAAEELSLEVIERRHILRLLSRHRNISQVARILEINRRTLQRKIKAWGLESSDFVGH